MNHLEKSPAQPFRHTDAQEEQTGQQHQEEESYRADHPEIFTNPNRKAMESNIKPFLKMINFPTMREIIKEHGHDYRSCNKAMVLYLSAVLGLDKTPQIEYHPRSEEPNTNGSYNHYGNTINFYYEENREKEMSSSDVDTIAHEIWHAYQYSTIEKSTENDPNPELYRMNFAHYISGDEDYHGYSTQLVESEARLFAEYFTNKLNRSITRRIGQRVGRIA